VHACLQARFARRVSAGVGALGCALLLLACTSSGDGGQGDIDDVLQSGAAYVSDRPASEEVDVVYLTEAGSSRDELCVDVEVGSVVDLFAVAFQLEYDADLLRYRGFTNGTFFGLAAQSLHQVDAQPDPARGVEVLTVGVTRVAGQPGVVGCSSSSVCATARGPVITLCWDLLAPGTTSLDFVGNLGGFPPDSTDPADRIIDDAGFYGGTVTIE